jgi:cupin superfamily acireductone dioxygenase involved in methionine salvage
VDKTRVTVSQNDWIIVPNTHELIITREDFEAVQRMLASRYIKRPKAKTHFFINLVFCADCGTSLWYLQSRKGYVCYRKHGKDACTSHSIKEDYLKKLIIDDLRQVAEGLLNKDMILKEFELKAKKEQSEKNKRLSQMEKEIEDLKNENRKYIKLLVQ